MRINLLPKHERGRSRSRVDWLRMAWIGAGLLTVVVIAFTVYSAMSLDLVVTEEADLFARVSTLRVEQSALNRQRTENNELEQQLDKLDQSVFVDKNLATVALLTDSARAVPEDAWLELLTVNSGRSLYASGRAADTEDLSRFLRSLRSADRVTDIQLETMERIDGIDGYRRDFSVSLTVEEGAP